MESSPETASTSVAVVFDGAWCRTPPGWRHGPRPAQIARLWRLVRAAGWLDTWPNLTWVKPRAVDEAVLCLFHSEEYVQAVRAVSEGRASLLDPAAFGLTEEQVPVFPGIHDIFWHHVAAVVSAVQLLVEGQAERAFTPAGGYHLVRPGEARGLGVYNDVAIGLLRLREAGWRVAYIDLDAHHPDVIQAAFGADSGVLTVSLHEGPEFRFPGSGAADDVRGGYAVNIPLPPGAGDEHAVWAFEQVALPVLEHFAPDVVVIQAGCGLHASDPLSHTRLTTCGFWTLWNLVAPLASRRLVIGGDGFGVEAGVRLWALALAHLAGCEIAPDEPLPHAYRDQWGGSTFHDVPPRPLKPDMDEYVWHYVRRQVALAQRHLFPHHGLAVPEGVPVAPDYTPEGQRLVASSAELRPGLRFPMVAEPEPVSQAPPETETVVAAPAVEDAAETQDQPAEEERRRSRRRRKKKKAQQRSPSAEQEREAAASRRRRRRSRRGRKRRK